MTPIEELRQKVLLLELSAVDGAQMSMVLQRWLDAMKAFIKVHESQTR